MGVCVCFVDAVLNLALASAGVSGLGRGGMGGGGQAGFAVLLGSLEVSQGGG